jgi:tetratricopeptide (TPR) repeat protein
LQRQILALNQVALVQQAQNRIPQALETANESVRKSERLLTLTREPDTVMLIAAGAAHSLRGMLLARRNEESSATADLTKAGNILQQALVAAPLDPQIRLEYAQTLNRLAFLATRAGELKSATELNSRALPLVQPPVTVPLNAWPPATLHSAAQILADLATGHATMGNLEQAARNLGLGVDYLREALRRQPDYDLWRLALWRLLDSLGNVELDRGDADAAQESFASALTTIENLTSRDDGNTRFAAARVVALARLSAVPMQLGRWNDARTMLERAQATAETIIARNGTQGDGRDVLALVRENLSRVLRRTDRGREAMAYAQQALIARETARREEPSSVARHTELISSQIHAAEAAIAAGETTTALRYASQAREEANVLIQRAPQSFHWRVLSAAADMAHSDASRAVGNTGDADSSALGALDTLRLIEGGITPDIPSPALTIVIRAQEAIGKASDIKSLRETMAHRGIDQGWAAAPGSPRR